MPARTDEPAQPNPSSFHTAPTFLNSQKKSGPYVARRGPRARNNISIATPPPGLGRRAPTRPTVESMVPCSPVAFNDIKHLGRSMPADGLEAQDVVPPRCGCWVAHMAIFSSRRLVFGQSTHARARTASRQRLVFGQSTHA